jgi:dimethylhistidine N-methyltransferase
MFWYTTETESSGRGRPSAPAELEVVILTEPAIRPNRPSCAIRLSPGDYMPTSEATKTEHHDLPGRGGDFREEVLRGLGSAPKWLPGRFVFDKRGGELHAMLCRQPEYYLREAEDEIYGYFGGEIARAVGSGALLVQWGPASEATVFALLDNLGEPAGYVAVGPSREVMQPLVDAVADRFPTLRPVCVSTTSPVLDALPQSVTAISQSRVVFCPGGAIGDRETDEARALVRSFQDVVGPGGKILVGVDLDKPREEILPAYSDKAQLMDRLHLNLLRRANSELGADFDLMKFRYQAAFDGEKHSVEQFVVSMASQRVSLDGKTFHLANNERIRTQVSYKLTQEQFQALAHEWGASATQLWMDSRQRFSTYLLESS